MDKVAHSIFLSFFADRLALADNAISAAASVLIVAAFVRFFGTLKSMF